MKIKKLLLFTISCAALCILEGCATAPNGFSQFYQDRAGAGITNLPPYSGSTKVFTTSNVTNDLNDLYRNGFVLIGVSAFQGPPQANNALMSQAKKVGADVILLSSVYLGSQQVAVPYLQYNPGTILYNHQFRHSQRQCLGKRWLCLWNRKLLWKFYDYFTRNFQLSSCASYSSTISI